MTAPATTPSRGRRRPAPDHILRLDFAGVDRPVLLVRAEALLPDILATTCSWPVSVTALPPGEVPSDPMCSILGVEDGTFTQLSIHLAQPVGALGRAAAVCGVIADLSQSYENRPGWLALHCGAFRSGGRLAAVTGTTRAGKSTLIARLSAEPQLEIVCDDVLPVDPDGQALALGVGPRLRLPLPKGASRRFRAHVRRTMAVADRHYGYLRPDTLSPRGTVGRIEALILLDRREDAPAAFHAVGPAEAVAHLLRRNFAVADGLEARLDRAMALAERALCLRLVYSELEAGVALIGAVLPPEGNWPAIPPLPALPPSEFAKASAPPRAAVPEDLPLHAAPNVAVRPVGDTLFLCLPERQDIVQLNAVGAAIWRLIETPLTGAELTAVLSEAFPDTAPSRIAADVEAVLADLVSAGLANPPRQAAAAG